MQLRPFHPSHLEWLQERGYLDVKLGSREITRLTESSPYAFSGMHHDTVLFCGGVGEYYPGRGEAWAIIHKDCRKEFLKIHHAVRMLVAKAPYRRIEATVVSDFEAGLRWMHALGFEREGLLRKYFPDGRDAVLYARVKE